MDKRLLFPALNAFCHRQKQVTIRTLILWMAETGATHHCHT